MKWYLGASLHGGLAKTADPHRDPHAERADGSSGNRDVEEYFNSSENDQKRPENDIFRIFLLFVISRSGVQVWPLAPLRNDLWMSGDRASASTLTAKVFLRSKS